MAFPVVTNISGANPGPNSAVLPDTVQMPTGNIQKFGYFNLTLSPTIVAANTTAEQSFAATGIGLQTTDVVLVQKPTPQAGLGLVGARVSANDTLAITFMNDTGAGITPTPAQVYQITVIRIQPNWTAPAVGTNQLDW